MIEYFQIWFNTKNTFKHLLSVGVTNFRLNIYYSIYAVIGVIRIKQSIADLIGDEYILFYTILIVTGIIFFLISKFFVPYMYWKFSKIWNGKANLDEYKLVVGLSLIPYSIVLIYELIQLLANQEISYRSYYFAYMIAWIFSIKILLIGIKYIQNFNNHQAVLNILLPVIITEIIILTFTY